MLWPLGRGRRAHAALTSSQRRPQGLRALSASATALSGRELQAARREEMRPQPGAAFMIAPISRCRRSSPRRTPPLQRSQRTRARTSAACHRCAVPAGSPGPAPRRSPGPAEDEMQRSDHAVHSSSGPTARTWSRPCAQWALFGHVQWAGGQPAWEWPLAQCRQRRSRRLQPWAPRGPEQQDQCRMLPEPCQSGEMLVRAPQVAEVCSSTEEGLCGCSADA